MSRLVIRHHTRYDYEKPVRFTAQRLLVRPRDSHAIRLISASLELSPPGETRWVYDAMGNCVCWFQPAGEAKTLEITSRLVIDRFPAPLAPITLDDPRSALPLVYDLQDRIALAPLMTPVTDDPSGAVLSWLRGHLASADEPVLELARRLNEAIHAEFAYQGREAEGIQSPAQTLSLKSGACRDFAWLLVETLRRVGCAAVFVTGYLNSPNQKTRGAGATHAWCEAFLPGLGWLEFDPTNGLVESPDLIRVGGTRTPEEAAPVAGNVIGDPGNVRLHVEVDVAPEESAQAAA